MTAEELQIVCRRLLAQVGHWETGRWEVAATGPGSGRSRGDVVYALVQKLADLGAEAEGRPPATVPREPDMILPDQLKVMIHDLVATPAPTGLLERAGAEIAEVRAALA